MLTSKIVQTFVSRDTANLPHGYGWYDDVVLCGLGGVGIGAHDLFGPPTMDLNLCDSESPSPSNITKFAFFILF